MKNVVDTSQDPQEPCSVQQAWELWYSSPQGSFALLRHKALLQRVLSSWHRRGHSLLNVQCGSGIFLEFFWEGGFDVTGVDSQPQLVAQAQERLNGKAEIHLATPDYLPFEDNEFDYVALLHGFENTQDGEHMLAEALRVAAKGVVLTFSNPWSLAYATGLGGCCLRKQHLPAPWNIGTQFSPLHYYKMLRGLAGPARICLRTTLLGPQWTWANYVPYLNCMTLPLPLGAVGALRADQQPLQTGTALPLRLQNVGFKNLSPVRIMERRHKDAS